MAKIFIVNKSKINVSQSFVNSDFLLDNVNRSLTSIKKQAIRYAITIH